LEQLDQRLVPSTTGSSSAISINHSLGQFSFTERDWFTIDQSTTKVVEFQGTTRHNLGGPTNVLAVSATVDPNTGWGGVFALAGPVVGPHTLWWCDSSGNWWNYFTGTYKGIDATRDGHVYAVTQDGSDVVYWNANGTGTDLGAPTPRNRPWADEFLAASTGWSGHNEVFALGEDQAIYVNTANTIGAWQLVDNSQRFWFLSASANNTLFALTVGGHLYQETESFSLFPYPHFSWTGQDISGGRVYSLISADNDAVGRAEVYAVQTNPQNFWLPGNLYLYDQGSWSWKDSDVSDVSGADGGFFYDVNYANNTYPAWLFDPNAGWTYLGSGLW
jgi:hypothetical protein